jgi:hypothetical protein
MVSIRRRRFSRPRPRSALHRRERGRRDRRASRGELRHRRSARRSSAVLDLLNARRARSIEERRADEPRPYTLIAGSRTPLLRCVCCSNPLQLDRHSRELDTKPGFACPEAEGSASCRSAHRRRAPCVRDDLEIVAAPPPASTRTGGVRCRRRAPSATAGGTGQRRSRSRRCGGRLGRATWRLERKSKPRAPPRRSLPADAQPMLRGNLRRVANHRARRVSRRSPRARQSQYAAGRSSTAPSCCRRESRGSRSARPRRRASSKAHRFCSSPRTVRADSQGPWTVGEALHPVSPDGPRAPCHAHVQGSRLRTSATGIGDVWRSSRASPVSAARTGWQALPELRRRRWISAAVAARRSCHRQRGPPIPSVLCRPTGIIESARRGCARRDTLCVRTMKAGT